MSSNCDLCKENFDHKFIDVVPIEKLKPVLKWFNWKNNENDQLEKNFEIWKFGGLIKKVGVCFGSIYFPLVC